MSIIHHTLVIPVFWLPEGKELSICEFVVVRLKSFPFNQTIHHPLTNQGSCELGFLLILLLIFLCDALRNRVDAILKGGILKGGIEQEI